MTGPGLSRRSLLLSGAAAAAALGLQSLPARGQAAARVTDFATLPEGEGWPGWVCPGVANLHRRRDLGVLVAGSDVFPCDPRPVAFMLDTRFRDAEIAAAVRAHGAGAGLVLRRTGPRDYLAAIYDDELRALVLVRRTPEGAQELARAPVSGGGPKRLFFSATGSRLVATVERDGQAPVGVQAYDPDPLPGDPGVLATARTLFPSEGPPVLPALGNLHLLPWGVQEGQAFMASPAGGPLMEAIRERSTATFAQIAVRGSGRRLDTPPSVIAAGTGAPVRGGAIVRVATDVPARVEIEVASSAQFRRARVVKAGITGPFDSVQVPVRGGEEVFWRPRVRRRRRTVVGPTRTFRAGGTTIAIGSCASQFGPLFDLIEQRRPDVFVWQGDLNYPDTVGPLAQTMSGYAGIWRDFLANPRMEPILARTAFAVQRDDHDYGLQDANSTNLLPHGLAPWEELMERRPYYRFRAGAAELWVLDQRLHKTDPAAPDTDGKTLLGARQREWLLRTLSASRAPFKIVCSPCTLAPLPANARDGSWAAGYTTERDLILRHIRERTGGRTVFVTGDTHWTMAYEREGVHEVRPCPLGIPAPNDITLTQPNAAEEARSQPGVVYADDERGHVAFLSAGRDGLDIELVREDGAVPYRVRLA